MGIKNTVADREGETFDVTNKSLNLGILPYPKKNCYVNFSKKDIKNSVNSILRLYRVNSIYYYRKTINKKTYRISLKTKDLQEAKLLRNELNLLNNEEFLKMAQDKKKDEKKDSKNYIPDPEFAIYMIKKTQRVAALNEELKLLKEQFELMDLLKKPKEEQKAIKNKYLEYIDNKFNKIMLDEDPYSSSTNIKENNIKNHNKEKITFDELENLFLKQKEKVGKVGLSSIKMYKATFKDLKEYFKDIDINLLKYKDFENFQNFLIEKKLNNKTINNKITYLKMYLDYALKFEFVEKNLATNLEMLKEELKEKENYTNEEVNLLLNNSPQEFKNFLKVAAYTGMRLQEILYITKIEIDKKTHIKYIQVGATKTISGTRKVPLHKELENIQFPLFEIKKDVRTYSTNLGKRVNRYIETIAKDKTIHTFRATFINRLVNNFPERIEVIQEIVGHSKGSKDITLNTYSKEFDLKLKKEIIDSIEYSEI